MHLILSLVIISALLYLISFFANSSRKFHSPLILNEQAPLLKQQQPRRRNIGFVVTGAASGLGFDLTKTLLLRDATPSKIVVFTGVRKLQDCDKFKEISTQNEYICVLLDISIPSQIDSTSSIIIERLKKDNIDLYGLINNAAIGMPGITLKNPSYTSELEKVLDVNILGVTRLSSKLISSLLQGAQQIGSARIINIGSLLGIIATPRCGGYCATKFALEALSTDWRYEFDPSNISVSIVDPGFFSSGMCNKEFCVDGASVCTTSIIHGLFDEHPLPRYFCASVFGIPAKIISILTHIVPDRVLDFILREFEKNDASGAIVKE